MEMHGMQRTLGGIQGKHYITARVFSLGTQTYGFIHNVILHALHDHYM